MSNWRLVIAGGNPWQHARHYFAGGIAGELVDEVHIAGDGMVGKLGAYPVTDSVFGQGPTRGSGAFDDPHGDSSEGFVVVHTAGVEVLDTWHGLEDFFYGPWEDVFAADDDHVVCTAEHVQQAAFIEVAAVADLDEFADALNGDAGVGVAVKGGVVVAEDTADGSGRNRLVVVVENADGGAFADLAGNGGVFGYFFHVGDGRCGDLGAAVEVTQDFAKAIMDCFDEPWG